MALDACIAGWTVDIYLKLVILHKLSLGSMHTVSWESGSFKHIRRTVLYRKYLCLLLCDRVCSYSFQLHPESRASASWKAKQVLLSIYKTYYHRNIQSEKRDLSYTGKRPGARFTNGFLPAIQIRWILRLAITPLLAIRSQQIFAHATTAQL